MKNRVRYCIVFAFLLSGVHLDQNLQAIEKSCIHDLDLDEDAIQGFNNQNITPEHNSDFNSFLACYWKKKGIQDEHGAINWEMIDDDLVAEFRKAYVENPALTTSLAEEMIIHAAAECRDEDIKGNTHGQIVARVRNCVMKKMQSVFDNIDNIKKLSKKLFVTLFKV